MSKKDEALKLAQAVIDAARAAMDESFEAGNEQMDISIPAHLAAALSLRLDEYDCEALAEQTDASTVAERDSREINQPAQQQEPAAWRWTNRAGWKTYGEMPHDTHQSVPLYTSPQPAIPPGYKLVPVEPTFQMIDAGAQDLKLRGLQRGHLIGANECYAAMLNAAPQPEGAQG